jgi:hypothetical protein
MGYSETWPGLASLCRPATFSHPRLIWLALEGLPAWVCALSLKFSRAMVAPGWPFPTDKASQGYNQAISDNGSG